MVNKEQTSNRLPRTFHSTFIPERQYIAEMLRFAAGGKEGTYQDIRDATGIPMGGQTTEFGKTPPVDSSWKESFSGRSFLKRINNTVGCAPKSLWCFDRS